MLLRIARFALGFHTLPGFRQFELNPQSTKLASIRPPSTHRNLLRRGTMSSDSEDDPVKPLVVRMRGACRMYGDCSKDEVYGKIKRHEIDSYLDGRRRLIVVASIQADIARRVAAAAAAGF